MKRMSPEAARLFAKIVRIGPSYFDLVLPLHEREVELCDLILKAESPEEARQLTAELRAVHEQINAIGETLQ
jgi:hypothetical protein